MTASGNAKVIIRKENKMNDKVKLLLGITLIVCGYVLIFYSVVMFIKLLFGG